MNRFQYAWNDPKVIVAREDVKNSCKEARESLGNVVKDTRNIFRPRRDLKKKTK